MKHVLAAACLVISIHSLPCRAAVTADVPPPIAAVATVLQLNEDQVKALVTMVDARDNAIRPLMMELQQHGQALENPPADAAATGQLFLEARALQAKIGEIRQQAAAQFEQVLTPDQAERLHHIREAAALNEIVPAFRAAGLV